MLRCSCWDYFFVPHKGYIRIIQVSLNTNKKHDFWCNHHVHFPFWRPFREPITCIGEDNCHVNWTVRPFDRMVLFKMLPVSLTRGIWWSFFVTCSHISVRLYGKKLVCPHRREHRETAAGKGTRFMSLEGILPRPLQGIPDKPQLFARVTPIKMTLRTPYRCRWSLHKGMGHVMGCVGKSIFWLQESCNGTFEEGKKAGKEMNLGDLGRSNHREMEG